MSRLEKLIAQYCPNGVEFQKIGDICNVFAGGTPKTSNSDFYDGEIFWVRSGELNFNILSSTEKTITKKGLENSSAKMIKPNSVLIAMTGATVARCAVNSKLKIKLGY